MVLYDLIVGEEELVATRIIPTIGLDRSLCNGNPLSINNRFQIKKVNVVKGQSTLREFGESESVTIL